MLLVLLLLSLTLGLSYAMVRSQNTQSAIGRNADRRALAHQAAVTGLTMAFQNMFSRTWTGVGTTFTKSLTGCESFSVTYTAGDSYLVAGSTDYDKYYAYRVTLDSTGTSADPGNPTCVATHKARAVVQLIPQKLVSEPQNWSDSYTLFQYSWSGSCDIAVPFRATGPVRLGAWVELAHDYNWSSDARNDYLTGLNVARTSTWSVSSITRSGSTATATCTGHGFSNGDSITISSAAPPPYNGTFTIGGVTTNTFTYSVSGSPSTPAGGGGKIATKNRGTVDWRPLVDQVTLPTGWLWQESGLTTLLQQITGVAPVNGGLISYAFAPSSAPSTYRLYAGGPRYNVVTLPQDCSNQQLWKPDPVTNPLGIFARTGTVNLYDNATIQGSVFIGGSGDMNVLGKNVQLTSQDLLPLYGTTTKVRLPIVMSQDDLRIYSGASGLMQGMATVGGTFEIMPGGQTDDVVSMQLKIAASSFLIHERTEWDQTSTWWDQQYDNFKHQPAQGKITYFPDYLQQMTTLRPQPTVIVSPDTATPIHYHWNNLQTTIYDYPDTTHGLSWQVVQWLDNP